MKNIQSLSLVYTLLYIQPSLTSHTRNIIHDVPVGVVQQRNWDDYSEPNMPDFDVSSIIFILKLIPVIQFMHGYECKLNV